MQVVCLKCEFFDDPAAIDVNCPRLSWQVKPAGNGRRLTGYQVIVSDSRTELDRNAGNLWDSGRVEREQCLHAVYGGQPLASRQRCYWKARVWDEAGRVTDWSDTASWAMGLLRPQDWTAVWIGAAPAAGPAEFPWLRKTFKLESGPLDARVYIASLGYHEVYVNGVKLGDDLLAPAVSQLSRRVYYVVREASGLLRPGSNCLAVWLGSGWYHQGNKGYAITEPVAGPLARVQLEIELPSGERYTVASDSSWKTAPSPWSRLDTANWPRCYSQPWSLVFDAEAWRPDWSDENLDDSKWSAAAIRDPGPLQLSAQPVELNRILRHFKPVSVERCAAKTWQLDFGSNLAGGLAIRFPPLQRGQTVHLTYFDRLLDENGEASCPVGQDVYRATGSGAEQFVSQLNYQAFRYVRASGLDSAPVADATKAFLITTDCADASSFACSNARLTAIHDMVKYTFRCLTLGGYMVDCPHIERLGYGGDGQASLESALMMYDLAPFYRSWLNAWLDSQEADGDFPHTAPAYFAGGGPYWCGFPLAASWLLYRQYADRATLELVYPAILKWLAFVEKQSPGGGLMQLWPATDRRNWCLGDWAVPPGAGVDQTHEPSIKLIINCYRILCYEMAALAATALDRPSDATRWRSKAQSLRPLVHAAFYDGATGIYADGDQIDLAFPLLAGIVPEALRAQIESRLEEEICVQRQGHLGVGLVGVPVLVSTLTELNRHDLLFKIVNQDTYPGWGYMLANGATTTWEYWNGRRSHIHNCYNGIGSWFYQGLAGLRPDAAAPGFARFTVCPAVVGDLTWVRARYDSVRGPITSEWQRSNSHFELSVSVPAGSTATVLLPATLKGDRPSVPAGAVQLSSQSGRDVYRVESGRHIFAVKNLRP